jgi:hypothetical protein
MQGTYLTATTAGTGSLLPTPTASLTNGPTDTIPDASWVNQPRAARNLAAVSVDPTIHPDRFKRATGTDDGRLW